MSVIEHHGCFIILWVCVDFLLDFFSNKYGGGLAMGRKEKKRLFAKLRPAGGGRALAQYRGESGLDVGGKGVSCMQEMKRKKTHARSLPPTPPVRNIYKTRASLRCASQSPLMMWELPANFYSTKQIVVLNSCQQWLVLVLLLRK